MSKTITLIAFILIFFLGFVLRTYKIESNPPGFFADEASIGFNDLKLLETGRDEHGIPFPIFFRSFGEYGLPMAFYTSTPFIAILGMSEFSVRLATVVVGFLCIIFTSLFTKQVSNFKTALAVGFLMAISPWHFLMSRWGVAYIYVPTLISMAMYFFIRGVRQKKFLPLGFFLFGLSMYTYFPGLYVAPLLLFGGCVLLFLKTRFKTFQKSILLGVLLFAVTLLPIYFGFKSGDLWTRWNSVNTVPLGEKKVKQTIQFYFDHFSLDFLFRKGDIDMPGHFITRHSVRGIGELYWFQLPLLIIGIFYTLIKKRTIGHLMMFWLLLLYPIGSSLANDGAYANRSIVGIIPLTFFSGVGLIALLNPINGLRKSLLKVLLYGTLALIISLSFFQFFNKYFYEYPLYSSDFWGWQYGPRDIMKYFLLVENQYDDLYLSGEFNGATIFPKFYDPENHCLNKCQIGNFYEQPEIVNPARKQIFSLSPDYLNKSLFKGRFKVKQTIYYPNSSVAFYIGEIVE